jgi:hypothetical protein
MKSNRIKVPVHLDESSFEWGGDVKVTVESDDDGLANTSLIDTFDKAALLGLLRRLHSQGILLISVDCVGDK